MSEEKLYVVRNAEGEYWDFADQDSFFELSFVSCPTTAEEKDAKDVIHDYGGHVVAFVEEPKKVVLSKEEAEIVEGARNAIHPASYIHQHCCDGADEDWIMNAYVNGYTVEKEKRYMVELDGLVTTDGAKQYLTKKDGKWFACRRMPGMHQDFTYEELNKAPEWAQQLDRKEVTGDEQ